MHEKLFFPHHPETPQTRLRRDGKNPKIEKVFRETF